MARFENPLQLDPFVSNYKAQNPEAFKNEQYETSVRDMRIIFQQAANKNMLPHDPRGEVEAALARYGDIAYTLMMNTQVLHVPTLNPVYAIILAVGLRDNL